MRRALVPGAPRTGRPLMRLAALSPLIFTAALAARLSAQDTVQNAAGDLPPLSVFGFSAGEHLREVMRVVDSIDGGRLRCDRSRMDSRVDECRATLTMMQVGEPVQLWLSAIDSVAGVLTLAATLAPDELDEIRTDLERQYGRVGAQVQNQQWMMQWVRQGRMMRLTWKAQQGGKATSLSLVDGHVLDAWSAPRRGAPSRPPAPAEKKSRARKDSSASAIVEPTVSGTSP